MPHNNSLSCRIRNPTWIGVWTDATHPVETDSADVAADSTLGRHGVLRTDVAQLAVEFHPARAAEDIVNLLGLRVVVLLRGGADGDGRLGQALVADGRVAIGEQFANLGAVLGGEGRGGGAVDDVHARLFRF